MDNKIAYLGNPGTFGYEAANKQFGPAAVYQGYPSHAEVFASIANNEAKYGVMAIENVDAGLVSETIRSLVRYQYFNPDSTINIVAEIIVPVHLIMMARHDSTLNDIKVLASHEMALLQSSTFVDKLKQQYPDIRLVKVSSTSEAARLASEDPSYAALASSRSMHEFGLNQIQDDRCENKTNNFTRFFIIAKEQAEQTGIDKMCLLLHLNRDSPGSLSNSLQYFKHEFINLSILHPFPHPEQNFEYLFVAEFEASIHDPRTVRALNKLQKEGVGVQVLGSYENRSTSLVSDVPIYQRFMAVA